MPEKKKRGTTTSVLTLFISMIGLDMNALLKDVKCLKELSHEIQPD